MELRSIQELANVLKANPEDRDALVELGIVYAENEEYQKAKELFEKASKLYPDDPVIYYDLGFLYKMLLLKDTEHLELWEDVSDEQVLMDDAIYYFQKALEINPDYINALNNLASLYAIRNDYDDAITLWKRSLELDDSQELVRNDIQAILDKFE